MPRVLVVDDEAGQRIPLERSLRNAGYETESAANGAEALEAIQSRPVDLVVTDVRMPGMDGRELLRRIREIDAALPVIVITAYAELRDAVELVTHEGASYYIEKPIEDLRILRAEIERALAGRDSTPAPVSESPAAEPLFEGIVGSSPPMRQLLREMSKLLPILRGPATVLVTGESGTGKELVAQALHTSGPRRDAAFVPVHCAAIPEDLMESELFGAERGAYTGSTHTRTGYFEEAEGGTLFLDEISEVSPLTQVKLLRVLSAREYNRVGSSRPRPADVCVVAATNRELEKDVASGRFREDLYYRLNVFRLNVPPLRQRRDDIPMLARYLLNRFTREFGLPEKRLDEEAVATLRRFHWPGNVRQLDHYIQQAVVMSDTDDIRVADLPAETNEPGIQVNHLGEVLERGMSLEEVEHELITMALERVNGNQTRAAKLLGISRRKLQYRMERHKISSSAFRDATEPTEHDEADE
ncbi:sigma-54-dependent Fis family transcriptional regulator [Candidatus Poribacteria bacterium]|nr:sigma-54-dependent Fis family transcriptional regulator [Candidatus Poribacteria bacterium]